MKAMLNSKFGGLSDLTLSDLALPELAEDAIEVAVELAAINFMDSLIIEAKYQIKPPLPFSPSAEMVGRVVRVGAKVTGFAPGERVAAYLGYGCCQELVHVPVAAACRVPEGVASEQAAGLIVAYGTSYHALAQRGALKPGETLAVLGASGGAGLAAVELGKAMGARVIACASSAEKLELTKEYGADETINYAEENLKEALKSRTEGRGVDLVYDAVGGDYAEAAIRAMAWGGRFLVVGFASGTIPKIPLNLLLLKGCSLAGVYWGRLFEEDPETAYANNAWLMAQLEAGKLRPHVSQTFPLAETAAAIEAIKQRRAVGKVLVRVSGEG